MHTNAIMKLLLRLHVLSLLVGSAFSLNHGAFLGDGNDNTAATPGIQLSGSFFDDNFFAPLPPLPLPPSKKPTPSPAITPTFPPVPAGRWPSPVPPPTFKPASPPTFPTSGGIRRPGSQRPPTFAPVPAGRWQQPVVKPSPAPNNKPRTPPTFVPVPKPMQT